MPSSDDSRTTIFTAGSACGTLSIARVGVGATDVRFVVCLDEVAWQEALGLQEDQDLDGDGGSGPAERSFASFDDALRYSGRYNWWSMTPVAVAPQYYPTVISEIRRGGDPQALEKWAQLTMDDLRHKFRGAGLPTPPIPSALTARLRRVTDWCFASRNINPTAMYLFDEYLVEALGKRVHDYVGVSHAGHGANSYAITYQLALAPLVVIAQVPFGGVYMNPASTKRDVTVLFERIAALIEVAQAATSAGFSSKRGRLFVFESELRRVSTWAWLDDPPRGDVAARRLLCTIVRGRPTQGAARANALDAATEWIASTFNVVRVRRRRTLSDEEKTAIRARLAGQAGDVHALATEFNCSWSQIAGFKAHMKH